MNRRRFNKLAGLVGVGVWTGGVDLGAGHAESLDTIAPESSRQSIPAGGVVLEDGSLVIAFDSSSGALVRFERKSTRWKMQRRPELGVSFRLHAPLPKRRDNFVLGQKQRAIKVEKNSDRQVNLQWKNLIGEHGGLTQSRTFCGGHTRGARCSAGLSETQYPCAFCRSFDGAMNSFR